MGSLKWTVLSAALVLLNAGHGSPAFAADSATPQAAPDTKNVPVTEVEVKAEKERPAKPKEGSAEAGYKVDTVKDVGPWGAKSKLDTPYSIATMPSQQMENMGVVSVDDLYKVLPFTQPVALSTYFVNQDASSLRGFASVFGGRFLDGMRDQWAPPGLEDIETVEVLTGLSGFLYGSNHPGGMVNFVSKQPTSTPLANVTTGFRASELLTHVDLGGPLDKAGKFGYRLNVATQDGGTELDGQRVHRQGESLALDWHATNSLLFMLNASHQDYELDGTTPSWWGSRNFTPDPSKYWGQPWAEGRDVTDKYSFRTDWGISDNLHFRAGVRYIDDERKNCIYGMNTINANGTYSSTLYDVVPNRDYTLAGYGFLDYTFKTFALSHKVTLGWSGNSFETDSQVGGSTKTTTTTGSLASPNYVPDPALAYVGGPWSKLSETKTYNIQLGDEISFGDKLTLLVGLNDSFDGNYSYSSATGALTSKYGKSALTPSVSLMYKPIPSVTAYATYIEALQNGLIVPQSSGAVVYTNAGQIFNPVMSKQYEVGAKSAIGGTLLTMALFQIEQANQFNITNPNGSITETQDGLVRSRGIELTSSGKVTKDLTLMADISIQDPTIEKATSAAQNGTRPNNAAYFIGKLYAEYTIPFLPGLTLSGGVYSMGKQYCTAVSNLWIPAYTTEDLGLRYQARLGNTPVTMRFNVSNITDRAYFESYMFTGPPRTFSGSMTFALQDILPSMQ